MNDMSLRFGARKTLLLAALAAAAPLAAAATRLTVALDGSSVTVDNISTMPEATVRSLVLAADRSTQDGCPFDRPAKGLIRSGDRVVISDHYIAWLDMTTADGIDYDGPGDPPYTNKYSRSGELAGYWSLNPATKTFRFTGQADSRHCWNWARNELIPGSASPDGRKLIWDKYGPPTEHTIAVVTAHDASDESEDTKVLFAHNYSQMATNGQWKRLVDGQVNADGSVYFKTSGRLATGTGQVDITDGIDSNGVTAYINSEVEYFFRPTDILNAWRFSASRTTEANNVYMLYWVANADGQDMDPTECDVEPKGYDKWPSASYTTTWFTQASMPLIATFATNGQPSGYQFPSGTAVKMVNGPKCAWTNPEKTKYRNQDINSWKYQDRNANVVVDGSWMRVGESLSTPANSKRFLTYVHQMPNPNGNGTKASPFDFKFNRMLSWNETHDGTLGFGVASGPYSKRVDYTILNGGTWYYTLHALSSAY